MERHKTTNKDLIDLDLPRDLGVEKVDYMYSDPPWGSGNLKYWQTINNKMTGEPKKEVDEERFLSKVFEIANKHVKKIAWIEYSKHHRERFLEFAKHYPNLEHVATVETQYKSGNRYLKCDLHIFVVDDEMKECITQDYLDGIKDKSGFNVLMSAVFPISVLGETILDPACGLGMTAKVAKHVGLTFYGNELNRERLKRTEKVLENG